MIGSELISAGVVMSRLGLENKMSQRDFCARFQVPVEYTSPIGRGYRCWVKKSESEKVFKALIVYPQSARRHLNHELLQKQTQSALPIDMVEPPQSLWRRLLNRLAGVAA